MGGRDRYVIVGAGKTAMDTCLWLLRRGIAAAADLDQGSPRAREKIIGVLRSQLQITNDKLEKLLR